MRVTFESDDHHKFVFYQDHVRQEMVRCFYPDGEREIVTLDFFVSIMHKEAAKRKKNRADLRAWRERDS